MQYLLMCCIDEALWAKAPDAERGRNMDEYGPFAETKEQLGGYHLIECKDRNEAVSIALRIPTLPVGGTIEVRPLLSQE
jgi:hypothetical protein